MIELRSGLWILAGSWLVAGCTGGSSPTATEAPAADNLPPSAVAGPDSFLDVGDSVDLDGSGSFDPEGEPLAYRWSLVSDPEDRGPRLLGAEAHLTFHLSAQGNFVIHLTVTDPEGAADTDEVVLTAPIPNRFPTADAGPDQTVLLGTTVSVDASGSSDPDGDALSFSWAFQQIPVDPAPVLEDADQVIARFLPPASGTYFLTVTAQDPFGYAGVDEVRIEVVE